MKKWKRLLPVAIAALGVLSLTPQARAQRPAPGHFDFFLLSLSVAPSFCTLVRDPQSKPDCTGLTESSFEQTPLTVHGLWPNIARVSVNRQPFECSRAPLNIPDTLTADLERYMPGGEDLEQHEWSKHGTCSGMSSDAYFAAIVSLAKQANDTIGSVILSQGMIGQQVKINDLLSDVAARDPATAAALVVDCKQPRGGGTALIDEIRLTLSKDLKPIPANSVGMGQNSGCPQGAGLIPRAPG